MVLVVVRMKPKSVGAVQSKSMVVRARTASIDVVRVGVDGCSDENNTLG